MITKKDLENAIAECEASPISYQNCEKLATLYTIYDHLYADGQETQTRYVDEEVVGDHGDGEFFAAIRGKEAGTVWHMIGELVEAVSVLNPKLYENFLEKF